MTRATDAMREYDRRVQQAGPLADGPAIATEVAEEYGLKRSVLARFVRADVKST